MICLVEDKSFSSDYKISEASGHQQINSLIRTVSWIISSPYSEPGTVSTRVGAQVTDYLLTSLVSGPWPWKPHASQLGECLWLSSLVAFEAAILTPFAFSLGLPESGQDSKDSGKEMERRDSGVTHQEAEKYLMFKWCISIPIPSILRLGQVKVIQFIYWPSILGTSTVFLPG